MFKYFRITNLPIIWSLNILVVDHWISRQLFSNTNLSDTQKTLRVFSLFPHRLHDPYTANKLVIFHNIALPRNNHPCHSFHGAHKAAWQFFPNGGDLWLACPQCMGPKHYHGDRIGKTNVFPREINKAIWIIHPADWRESLNALYVLLNLLLFSSIYWFAFQRYTIFLFYFILCEKLIISFYVDYHDMTNSLVYVVMLLIDH